MMKKSPNVEGSGASLKTNRTLIGILCIIVALVLVFLVSPLLQKSSGSTKDIIRLSRDVARGDAITEADIEIVSVGSAGLPVENPKIWLDSAYQRELLQGGENGGPMYARTDLFKGDYFNQDKLIESNYATITSEDAFTNDLNGTKVAISVSAGNFAQMLSGKLLNGDIVSFITTPDGIGTGQIPPELRYVQVLTTTTENGYDRDNVPRNEDGTIDGAATITMIVRREQAQLLAFFENNASLHCALVCRGSDPKAKLYLEQQDAYLDEVYGVIEGTTITGAPTDMEALSEQANNNNNNNNEEEVQVN